MQTIFTKSNGKQPGSAPYYQKHLLLVLVVFLLNLPAFAQKYMEKLNRGVVAVRKSSTEVYVGWRMFGTDPTTIGFNLYRGSTKLNSTPITNSTNFIDNTSTNSTYYVKPVVDGVEQTASETVSVWNNFYQSFPLQIPAGGTSPDGVNYTYNANDCSVGDVDGDGEYEVILKWDPSNSKDNAQDGYTGNVYLDCYKFNGTLLWRIDLGINIRAGAHYTQFMVYDLDSDGKAEVACKTADGTKDGKGIVIGSATADYRNSAGRILSGPEYMTIFNGETGAAMATTNYLPGRGNVCDWGDCYGNRVDRFISAIAYADGQRPTLIMGRGYYTRQVRAAWDWRNGTLTNRWTFDSNDSGNSSYAGQGNHQMTVGDVDGDGYDEVFNGSSAVNENGAGLWSNGLGHGDALHLSDMNPDRAGQEIWQCLESPGTNGGIGLALLDAKTGSKLFTVSATGDVGRALAADIDQRYKGYELWGSTGDLYTATGKRITSNKPTINHALWWDADLRREILDGTKLDKWDYLLNSRKGGSTRLVTFYNYAGAKENNGTKANPGLSADLLGDWREEVIYRSYDNTMLTIFTTTTLATNRIYTLMHDAQYRTQVAMQNSAYNQPPNPGFYLGEGMSTPPSPNIITVGSTTIASTSFNETLGLTGLKLEEDMSPVTVYPNPSSDAFTIKSTGEFSYVIYNMSGKEVKSGKANNEVTTGSELVPGTYIIKIWGNENKTVKVIKN